MSPIYEYQCPKCGNKHDHTAPMFGEQPIIGCQPCIERGDWVDMKRMISPVAGLVKNPAAPRKRR